MKHLPPGPSGALRQSAAYASDPYGYATKMGHRYGDPFTMPMPTGPVVVFAHPDAARAMFTAPADTFDIWAKEQLIPVFGADSIFTVTGAAHRQHRQAVVHAAKGRGAMVEICRERMAALVPGQSIPLAKWLLDLSLTIILDVVFGARNDRTLQGMLAAFVATSGSNALALPLCYPWLRRPFYPPWRRFLHLRNHVRQILTERVAACSSDNGERQDMLSVLSRHLTQEAAVDDLLTMLVAGHETTARALAFACDHLAHARPVQEKLCHEIDSLPEDASLADLSVLPYLDAVCEETLRLHPVVVQVTRALCQPLDVMNYSIPTGTSVAISAHLVHRRPDIFADPDSFRPERFLEKRYSPFEHLPFGGGPTRCPGASMAKDEMKIVLFGLLRRFFLQPKRKTPARAVVQGLVMAPYDDVVMTLVPR